MFLKVPLSGLVAYFIVSLLVGLHNAKAYMSLVFKTYYILLVQEYNKCFIY